jgi:hypothetical protein
MPNSKNKIFTKDFWNRGRIIWTIIVGFFTGVPIISGSIYMTAKWAEANIARPYVCKTADSICNIKQDPLRQDIKTMINDVKYVRLCTEKTASEEVRNYAKAQMKYDSIESHKYITK